MTLGTLIEICKRYNDLGWSVQGQLHNVYDDPCPHTFKKQNPNALKLVAKFLRHVARNADDTDLHDEAVAMVKDITEFLAEGRLAVTPLPTK